MECTSKVSDLRHALTKEGFQSPLSSVIQFKVRLNIIM